MERSEDYSQDANRQRPSQRDELQQASRNSEHDRIRCSDRDEADREDPADDQEGCRWGGNESRQRVVDFYKEHVPARPQPLPGEDSQSGITQHFRVSENKKRENRNETQPGHIGKPAGDSGNQLLCDIRFSGRQLLSNRSIDRISCFRRKCVALVALLPGLPAILSSSDVGRSLSCQLTQLAIENREKEDER